MLTRYMVYIWINHHNRSTIKKSGKNVVTVVKKNIPWVSYVI